MTPCYGCDVKLICSQGVHCGCVIDSVAGAMVRVAKANLEHADIARRTLLEMPNNNAEALEREARDSVTGAPIRNVALYS